MTSKDSKQPQAKMNPVSRDFDLPGCEAAKIVELTRALPFFSHGIGLSGGRDVTGRLPGERTGRSDGTVY